MADCRHVLYFHRPSVLCYKKHGPLLEASFKRPEDILVIPLSVFDLGDHPFFKAASMHVVRLTGAGARQVQQLVSWLFWLLDVGVSFISGYDRILGKELFD